MTSVNNEAAKRQIITITTQPPIVNLVFSCANRESGFYCKAPLAQAGTTAAVNRVYCNNGQMTQDAACDSGYCYTGSNGNGVCVNTIQYARVQFNGGPNSLKLRSGTQSLKVNEWHHIVVSLSETTGEIFWDGARDTNTQM